MASIVTIQQHLERQECNTEICLFFIEYVKAFDLVLQNKLWGIMNAKGFHAF
jgi:hypothetical protein